MKLCLIASGSQFWELWLKKWGLSIFVDDTVLFDTFYNFNALEKKLRKANVSLDSIKTIVISHDHWDHIGGLWEILKKYQGLDVYLPAHADTIIRDRILSLGGHVLQKTETVQLKDHVYLMDELIDSTSSKPIAEHFLVLRTPKGLVLLLGCAHPGITKIVEKAQNTFSAPVHCAIGGFHLMNANTREIKNCALELKKLGVQFIAPTHCTGWKAERILKSVFQDSFIPIKERSILTF